MKKALLCCWFIAFCFMAQAQKSLVSLSDLTLKDLNAAQRMRYDKLERQNMHIPGGLHLVTTAVPPDVTQGRSITLRLPFLPCGSITFAASQVAFRNDDNFSWSGRTVQHQDSACASGNIIIQKNEGLFIGNITIDDNSYELFDLTGGLQLLIESDLDLMGKDECATIGGGAHPAMPLDVLEGPCADVKIKVLLLYTDATLQHTTDIVGTAHLGVAQNNQVWANSGVSNELGIAGIVKVDWNNKSNTKDELNNLGINFDVQALRDLYNAEMVVMLGPPYTNAYGQVKDIGGPYDSAYAAVDVTKATNGRYTFSHELNHLLGGRHENDPDPGIAHGKVFNSGFLKIFNKRYTLMSNLPGNKTRLMHLSNPGILFAGVATGNWNRNNAGKVQELQPYVANFKDDPALDFYTTMSMANPAPCKTDGTATAVPECGHPPYTYQWYTTNWPIGAAPWVPLGIGQSSPTHIPLSSYGSYSRAYRVVVTDAQGNTATYTRYAQSYCTEQQPAEPIDPYAAGKGNSYNNNTIDADGTTTGSSMKAQLQAYPNPSRGVFDIVLTGFAAGKIDIQLYDPAGRWEQKLYSGRIESNKRIPVVIDRKWRKGLYFLKVKAQSGNFVQKIILN